jgi:hypothetical protein
MDKIIDIELLSKIPITDELCYLLFTFVTNPKEVKVIYSSDLVEFRSSREIRQITQFGNVVSLYLSGHKRRNNICNAFQIVRYIDNYLQNNKLKSEVENANKNKLLRWYKDGCPPIDLNEQVFSIGGLIEFVRTVTKMVR